MPYNPQEKTIATKLFGISFKVDDIGRQQLLMLMRQKPGEFKIYVFGTTCYITYQKKEYVLGKIRDEYSSLLNTHDTEIIEWMVTGGYPIEHGDKTEIAMMGMNLKILLTSRVKEKSRRFAQIKATDVSQWNR